MAQKKKKQSKHTAQKLAMARHKNNFIGIIKKICLLTSGSNTYSLIPKNELEYLYFNRCHAPKIVAADEIVPRLLLDNFKVILPQMLMQANLPVSPGGKEMSHYEYYTAGLTFYLYLLKLKGNEFPFAQKLKQELAPFINFPERDEMLSKYLHSCMESIGMIKNNLNDLLYWAKYVSKLSANGHSIDHIIEIHGLLPPKKQVTINGSNRPVIRVGWTFAAGGIVWSQIMPAGLNINSPLASLPMEVYIQSHALQRLSERIDCFIPGVVHYNLFCSFDKISAFIGENNKLFIEYRLFYTKAGYLIADIIDGIVVIRTFLFLTNDGTPEGKKLNEYSRLDKLDKKYLSIDKLSTFMSMKIDDNNVVKEMFTRAGCLCLFELENKVKDLVIKRGSAETANTIVRYLEKAS